VTGIGVSINYSAISAVAENVQGFPQGKPRGQSRPVSAHGLGEPPEGARLDHTGATVSPNCQGGSADA
jgi:hypothetical protein